MATLQQQVQQYLQNTGISLRELSRRSGVSHTAIGKILKGGDYKNKTAYALNTVILRDSNFAKIVCSADDQPSDFVLENRPAFETLDATIEQLAAQRVNADLTHHADWDVDLQCAKYRRVMQLEKELEQTQDVLKQREQHLKSCENALIEANEKIQNVLDESGKQLADLSLQLYGANAEIKRLTALSETQAASWKAACVQAEQLQKQLDHGQAAYSKLYNQLGATRTNYETQLEAANQKEAQLQEQLTEVYATKTRQEAQIMRLRVYVWSLIAALVFVVASGLVVWGVR